MSLFTVYDKGNLKLVTQRVDGLMSAADKITLDKVNQLIITDDLVITWEGLKDKPEGILTQLELVDALSDYVTTGLMTDELVNTINLDNFKTIISPDYIASMRLIVGKEIIMGKNATISWLQVTGTQDIPIRDDINWDNLIDKPTDLLTQPQFIEALTAYVTTDDMSVALVDTINFGNFTTVITKDYIASMRLIVGKEIIMGTEAKITWLNVTGTEDIPIRSDINWDNLIDKPTDLLTQPLLVLALDDYVTNGSMTTALADTINFGNFNTIITRDYIASMNLVVGNEIIMGANATISWLNVSEKPTIPGPIDVSSFATINYVKTYVADDYIITGKISCQQITSPLGTDPIIRLFDNCAVDATAYMNIGRGNQIRLKWDDSNYYLVGVDLAKIFLNGVGVFDVTATEARLHGSPVLTVSNYAQYAGTVTARFA